MQSLVEVFGLVFAVALTLLFTTGVALWLDRLVAKRAPSGRPAAPTRPAGRVVYRRLKWNE
jgi:hypothetical protein